MKITDKHVFFFSFRDIYSNFARVCMRAEGKFFDCNEQYFMWRKAVLFNDTEIANKILLAHDPKEAKALGRKVKGFIPSIWDISAEWIMKDGLLLKAHASMSFRSALMHNHVKGLKHVEASPYDKIWGCGLAVTDPDINDPSKWPGQNKLGKCLDEVAETLVTRRGLYQ